MVDRVQLPSSQPAFDPPSADAKQFKLSSPHDAVLFFRQPSYPPIDRLIRRIATAAPVRPPFSVSETVFGGRVRHAADGEGTRRTGGALRVNSV
ncbi:MAG TPA: hypothetical protein VKH20_10055 [Solirubrobacterales bacterium]|nr:hypothetical protein [Solirubrobacterales bacterium]